jgi:hypothetical protein
MDLLLLSIAYIQFINPKVAIVMKSKFVQLFMVLLLPAILQAGDITEEPQVLDPVIDQKLIRSFRLDNSTKDWADAVINILLVGQDGQLELPFPYITRENRCTGETIKFKSRRIDSFVFQQNDGENIVIFNRAQ